MDAVRRIVMAVGLLIPALAGQGAEPVTPDKFTDPGPNRANEPVAKAFSLEKGVQFLDSASLQWQKQRKCFTCHTNYAHLYVSPLVGAESPAAKSIRGSLEELVTVRWKEKKPRWDTEVVATATALAFNDAGTSGKLHATTRTALDRMWTVQKADGGWDWIKCEWPPMESDDDYGACVAALGVSVAPEEYRKSPAAIAGIEKLKGYFAKHAPPSLHHSAMLVWASSYGDAWLANDEQAAVVKQLRELQRADGGWSVSSLGAWKREDGSAQSNESDGYGTGFVVYVLRRSGVPADDDALRRGVTWLKDHQRESGRWFTRSLFKDGSHFLTHAGTAYALMALKECEPATKP